MTTYRLNRKKNQQSINNIFRSTTAFLRFVAIDAENFPNATPNFIKKAETIRDMTSSGNVFFKLKANKKEWICRVGVLLVGKLM